MIDLGAVLGASWQRVYFVEPYQRRLSTVRQVGLHWHALACTRSHAYDEWSQMIFTDGGDVVAYFDIPTHGLFEYSVISTGGSGYGREAAVLKVACPEAM